MSIKNYSFPLLLPYHFLPITTITTTITSIIITATN